MNVCRACLSSDNDLLHPDEIFKSNYNLLTNLQVNMCDGKSQLFCKTCVEAVNFFVKFRSQCVSSESTLQEVYTEQISKIIKLEKLEDGTEIDVKQEIKLENERSSYEDGGPENYDNHDSNYAKTESIGEANYSNTSRPEYYNKNDRDYAKTETIGDANYSNTSSPEYDDYNDSGYAKTETIDIKVKKTRKQTKKQKSRYSSKAKIAKQKCKSICKVTTTQNADVPTCGLCSKVFDDAVSLNNHLESHKSDRACKLCDVNPFEHWPQLLAHRLVHGGARRCHLCDAKFRSAPQLELHYWKVHCGEKNALLKCSLCPSKFSTPRRLTKHVWANHSAKRYVCDLCSKVFNNKQRLKSHLIAHGDLKLFVCDLCDYSSKYANGLAIHKVRKHVRDKCICKTCERVFADAEKLAQHACLDKSKICPVCGKELHRGFARHMRVHREDKRYKCARCPAAFRSREALRVHDDRHDGTPRHACDTCQRRFYSRPVLIKHRRVHTGEKPYACSRCDMRFTGGNNLKVHMKVHGELLVVKRTPQGSV